jgi:hypothetical protein
LKFKKSRPKTYQKLKNRTQLAKKRCLAVAVQAEKSTNVSVSLLERRSEIKRIADEKVSLKKAQDQLQETLER